MNPILGNKREPCCGKPVSCVRRRTTYDSPPESPLSCLLTTNHTETQRQLPTPPGRRNSSISPIPDDRDKMFRHSAPRAPFRRYSPLLHLPRMQKRAGGGSLWYFGGIPTSSTSLAGKGDLEVHLYNYDVSTVSESARFPYPPLSSQASILASSTSLASRRSHVR